MINFIRSIAIFFMFFSQLLTPFFQTAVRGGEEAFYEKWSASQEYSDEYATNIEKTPGKDFVILNVSDIQLTDKELNNSYSNIVKETVDRLVAEVQPDLITMTGDNAWAKYVYMWTANLLDSYGIPWAPVMGNHDGENCPSEFWCGLVMKNCKNCLFRFGPEGMGVGNYIINITENGNVIHTLFMMDSHQSIKEDNLNGVKGGYDHFWPSQFSWYEWAVKGIAEKEGHTVQSTVFMHIPLVEYEDAWTLMGDDETEEIKDEYKDVAFGVNHVGVWRPTENNGFFTFAKNLGSTKEFICGHDHSNNYSIPYEGIRLTYALKTGKGCSYNEQLNGGTVVTINDAGESHTEHHYVPFSELEIKRAPLC